MLKQYTRLLALLVFLPMLGFGQVAFQLSPVPHQQFLDSNGKPLAGGFVFTFSAGSSTPLATYKDNVGTANTNPIVLDAGGFATIYLSQNSYKWCVQNSSSVQQWCQDNVQNISQVLLTTANSWTLAQTFSTWINFVGGTSDTTANIGNLFYRTDLDRLRWYGGAWHSIIGADTTDTLTNKTLTSPAINSPTIATPTITGSATQGAITAPLTQTIASGTATMGTTLIASANCAAVVTVAATGALATDAISWSYQSALATGYAAGLFTQAIATNGNVNFTVCNPTAGSITPVAQMINWRVTR